MMRKIFLAFLFLFVSTGAFAVEVQEMNGRKARVTAWLVEDHKLPIISMSFAFQGGSEQDPPDKQGLAALTVAALTAGAGEYNAAEFQQQLADNSIALSFRAGRDEISGSLKCLSADKEKAFELLRLALTKPRFESADIERLRARQLAGVKNLLSDVQWQARYAAYTYLFEGHPYGQRQLGTLQTLPSITRQDIRDFAESRLARNSLTVAVAGDMRPEELSSALDAVFADLPLRARLSPVEDAPEKPGNMSILVRREGTQTNLFFALPGPRRSDPDYYAAEIANYILGGGGFSSRLMQDMRDKKGLTYGISTFLAPSQHAGMILGQAAIDNPHAAEAVALLRGVMRRLYEDKPALQEIAAAKDYLTGSMPLELTSTDKIADILVMMQREDLGRDYLDRYAKIIRGVTAADVFRVIERWFNPDKMTLVMAGKPQGVTALQIRDTVRE